MAHPSFSSQDLRNICLVGHGHSGKTSLAEAMLFVGGVTSRLGSVNDQTSLLDFEPEEHKRGSSIATAFAWLEHDGHKINLLDTPGDASFLHDALTSMRAADAAVVVISAPDGVEVGTERVFAEAGELGLPRIIFINKMDRERADAAACLAEIEEVLGVTPIPIQLPVGSEAGFQGVVSLFQEEAFIYASGQPGQYTKRPIPADMADQVQEAREALIDAVASTDDQLLEHYLETFDLPADELREGFRNALKAGRIVPVLFGSATGAVGALSCLELVKWACPSPLEREPVDLADGTALDPTDDGPFAAQVVHTFVDEFSGKLSIFRIFRGIPPEDHTVLSSAGGSERLGALYALRGKDRETVAIPCTGDILAVAKLKQTHTGHSLSDPERPVAFEVVTHPAPMMAYVIEPASKGDADKIKTALERLLEEDPTLSTTIDGLTGHMVLEGMGQVHLDMAVERMARKYKVSVETSLPPVPYRETLARPVANVEGKHKKQTGGAGQFGVAFLDVAPRDRDAGFEFVDRIKGGAIPNTLIPSVEKGIRERMKHGFLAGYPIVDIQVALVDGKYHPVDSKDVAFQMAGSKGLRAAFDQGGTVLLEPIMELEISVPTANMGDVMGDITSRRGRVLGMEPRGKHTVIQAHAPLASVQRYAPELKGMTGGKGAFTMQLSGYEAVPKHLVDGIVSASPFHKDDDE
ncbi:MAG: elongation factor G [Alphaproteobacteria bacterium]|nr:elongation factor G [Alphaproteobacteria bacterium]